MLHFCLVSIHEDIHIQIAKYHDCVDYDVNYGFLKSVFVCYDYAPRTQETKLQERWLHSLNEIIGYYLNFIILFFMTIFYIKMYRGERR